jgi:lipopolysaccharide/colanic/teichoic acid biosynthesis glycosyltransferase
MAEDSTDFTTYKRPLQQKLRFAIALIALSMLVSLLLFTIKDVGFDGRNLSRILEKTFLYSFLSILAATAIGYVLNWRFDSYPLAEATRLSIPAMVSSYAIVIVANFFLRVDYSRGLIFVGFVVSVIFCTLYFYLIAKTRTRKLALVAVGNYAKVAAIPNIDWTILQSPSDLNFHPSGVVVDLNADMSPEWEKFVLDCVMGDIPVTNVKRAVEVLTGRVEVEHLSENTFGSMVPSKTYRRIKVLADFMVALALLPVLGLIIALAAIAIKLESEGPAFFSQNRVGRNRKSFVIWKLRSMSTAAGQGDDFTSIDDLRITRIGSVLRRYRIDELPQIWNILKGEMSWIGPRPLVTQQVERYFDTVAFHAYRHIVNPGITGWAQVHQGNVAGVDEETIKLSYDFYYIKNFSFWLDALVVFKTFRTIMQGAN